MNSTTLATSGDPTAQAVARKGRLPNQSRVQENSNPPNRSRSVARSDTDYSSTSGKVWGMGDRRKRPRMDTKPSSISHSSSAAPNNTSHRVSKRLRSGRIIARSATPSTVPAARRDTHTSMQAVPEISLTRVEPTILPRVRNNFSATDPSQQLGRENFSAGISNPQAGTPMNANPFQRSRSSMAIIRQQAYFVPHAASRREGVQTQYVEPYASQPEAPQQPTFQSQGLNQPVRGYPTAQIGRRPLRSQYTQVRFRQERRGQRPSAAEQEDASQGQMYIGQESAMEQGRASHPQRIQYQPAPRQEQFYHQYPEQTAFDQRRTHPHEQGYGNQQSFYQHHEYQEAQPFDQQLILHQQHANDVDEEQRERYEAWRLSLWNDGGML